MEDLEKLKETIDSVILSDGKSTFEYDYVAAYFTGEPHPLSFEKRLIDKDGLLKWSAEQGYQINIDYDKECSSFENMPCITFNKK